MTFTWTNFLWFHQIRKEVHKESHEDNLAILEQKMQFFSVVQLHWSGQSVFKKVSGECLWKTCQNRYQRKNVVTLCFNNFPNHWAKLNPTQNWAHNSVSSVNWYTNLSKEQPATVLVPSTKETNERMSKYCATIVQAQRHSIRLMIQGWNPDFTPVLICSESWIMLIFCLSPLQWSSVVSRPYRIENWTKGETNKNDIWLMWQCKSSELLATSNFVIGLSSLMNIYGLMVGVSVEFCGY